MAGTVYNPPRRIDHSAPRGRRPNLARRPRVLPASVPVPPCPRVSAAMPLELVLFIGLQASGKSSLYRASFSTSHALVSKDRFPNNRHPGRRQRTLIEQALGAGRSVVVDNTNPTVAARAEPIALARTFGAATVGYYFASCLADCLERNRRREGKACVPDVALYVTRTRLQVPTLAEGFDRLYQVRLVAAGLFEVREWGEGASSDEI